MPAEFAAVPNSGSSVLMPSLQFVPGSAVCCFWPARYRMTNAFGECPVVLRAMPAPGIARLVAANVASSLHGVRALGHQRLDAVAPGRDTYGRRDA